MRDWMGMGLCFLVLVGPALAMGLRPEAPVEERIRPENPLERIARAREEGKLDADTATLYEVYAVVDAEKLPAAYRADGPIRDGTGVLRAARSRYDTLRPEIRERIRPYLFPRGRP